MTPHEAIAYIADALGIQADATIDITLTTGATYYACTITRIAIAEGDAHPTAIRASLNGRTNPEDRWFPWHAIATYTPTPLQEDTPS